MKCVCGSVREMWSRCDERRATEAPRDTAVRRTPTLKSIQDERIADYRLFFPYSLSVRHTRNAIWLRKFLRTHCQLDGDVIGRFSSRRGRSGRYLTAPEILLGVSNEACVFNERSFLTRGIAISGSTSMITYQRSPAVADESTIDPSPRTFSAKRDLPRGSRTRANLQFFPSLLFFFFSLDKENPKRVPDAKRARGGFLCEGEPADLDSCGEYISWH